MRRLPIVVAALMSTSALHAADLDVLSKIDSVTVYPDGATVTRVVSVDLPAGATVLRARDFPPGLDPASLRVEGAGAGVTIGAIDARPPRQDRPPLAPELENRIEALRDEKAALDDRIAAATARKSFVQRFADTAPIGLGDKGEARPLAEWRAAFAAVGDETALADTAIREARLRQREIDRELARLDAERNANPPRKMEVRIDLAAASAAPAALRVTYTLRGARWAPLYDARLVTGNKDQKPALELVRRAEITQTTGEDWTDVALAVSTTRTAKGGSAPQLPPLLVRYPLTPRPLARDDVRALESARQVPTAPAPGVAGTLMAPAEEQEAVADLSGFQALFRIPGRVSIAGSEGAKSFRIGTATIVPDLLVRATPVLDETAFLEASFKQAEDAPLLPGRIALYRDGVYVGRGQMPMTSPGETVRLGFGADDKVKVARSVLRKIEGTTGLISSSKTDEREFRITVRNGHDTPFKIVIEDQLPVSEIEEVQVDMLPGSTPPSERDVGNRRGVVAWAFDAAAGETREIKFGWRLRRPADKPVVFESRPR